MKVTVKLFKSKRLKNGENPIVIELSHNKKRKIISTGESAKPSNWLASGKVGSRDARSVEKNKNIKDVYDTLYNRCDECWNKLGLYDFSLICDITKPIIKEKEQSYIDDDDVKFDDFYNLIDYKAQTQKASSLKNYKQLKNYLISVYGDTLPMNIINQRWVDVFQSKLAENKSVQQQAKLSKYFLIVFNYGKENDLIENKKVTIDKKRTVYKVQGKKALSPIALKTLFDHLTAVLFSHKPERDYKLTYMMHNVCNGIMVYMLDFFFQGLAPIDLANIKIGDLQIKSKIKEKMKNKTPNEIVNQFKGLSKEEWINKLKEMNNNDIKYIVLPNGLFRKKTSTEAQLVIPMYKELEGILKFYRFKKDGTLKEKDDYLINFLDKDKQRTPKQQLERISNCVSFLKKGMIKEFENIDVDKNILDEFREMSLYTMRHTYITVGLRNGINKEQLASMAGHSVDEQTTYFDGYFDHQLLENNLKIYNSLASK